MEKGSLVYIAGYGRTGSSWLEREIGINKRGICVGERIQLFYPKGDLDLCLKCKELMLSCECYAKMRKWSFVEELVIDSSKSNGIINLLYFLRIKRFYSKTIVVIPYKHPYFVLKSRKKRENRLINGQIYVKNYLHLRLIIGYNYALMLALIMSIFSIQALVIDMDNFSSKSIAELPEGSGFSEELRVGANRNAKSPQMPYIKPHSPRFSFYNIFFPLYWFLKYANKR